ncbi:MAG TPA: diguanylate cyclase, partial [Gammaproteobacteria bacterium]|nr:diguanylate cyclase [Gammaproteobacteria bacterium]
ILVLAIVATLLPSLATNWISYFENKRSLEAKASEELLAVSAQTARELDLWLKERRYELRVFASSYEVTENVAGTERAGGGSTRRLTDYLGSVRERFDDYSELSVVDPAGVVVAAGDDLPDGFALPADWQTQLQSDDFVVGAPYWDSVNEAPGMLLAVPIRIGGGRLLGAITANLNLHALAGTLRNFAPAESGRVSLLTREGSVIVDSHDATAEAMALRYETDVVRELTASNGVPSELTNVAGQTVLGSMRSVPGLDWIVVAEIPSAEVFGQLARLRNTTLLIVAATLILAGGLGYALGVFIVRPLDRLTRAAANVAAGDLEVGLTVARGGEVGYLTRVFNDMVQRLRASRFELERLSVTDPVTGLDNRRRMMQSLQNEVLRSRRLKHSFAVLMADVDHFKAYNDAHGHLAGDRVLKHVAGILRQETRDVDSVARFGGEEFSIVMPNTALADAVSLGERLRSTIESTQFWSAATREPVRAT